MSGSADMFWRRPKQSYSPEAEDVTVLQRTWGSGRMILAPLYPHTVELAYRRSRHWYTTEYSRHLLIVYLPEGKLRYRFDNRSAVVTGRRILVIPPGKAFHFETVAAAPYRKYVLFVSGVNLPGILETLGMAQPGIIDLPETETLEKYFMDLYGLLEVQTPERLSVLAGRCLELLHYLAGVLGPDNSSPLLFNVIKNHIESNFSRGSGVEELGREFNVSPRTISRMFNACLHTTPAKYRRECRFRAACELLASTELSVKEIADRLGYCSQFHFSREFSRQSGLSPRAWRARRRAADR
ncbi:MAG: helix-turn-helix transcriptional regulator [Lentisphaeria bacterium]|nr:helix-turn-helix transcriptional regulator [Lentisphaeria bacterium]